MDRGSGRVQLDEDDAREWMIDVNSLKSSRKRRPREDGYIFRWTKNPNTRSIRFEANELSGSGVFLFGFFLFLSLSLSLFFSLFFLRSLYIAMLSIKKKKRCCSV